MEVRITKYNPSFRDSNGAFLGEDWTSVSDIGKYNLTFDDYIDVEEKYWSVLYSSLKDTGVSELSICDLEASNLSELSKNSNRLIRSSARWYLESKPTSPITIKNFKPLFQAAMREVIWFRAKGEYDTFVHFGYDFYLYFGSSKSFVGKQIDGIWVESFKSPYHSFS